MQKWEFLILNCGYDGGRWKPRHAGDEELHNWKRLSLTEYCASLGERGWELVNGVRAGGGASDWHYLYFKRPK